MAFVEYSRRSQSVEPRADFGVAINRIGSSFSPRKVRQRLWFTRHARLASRASPTCVEGPAVLRQALLCRDHSFPLRLQLFGAHECFGSLLGLLPGHSTRGIATCRLILEIEIRRRAALANFIGFGMLNDGKLFPVLRCISPPADHILPPTVPPAATTCLFVEDGRHPFRYNLSITMGRFDIAPRSLQPGEAALKR